MNGQKEKPRLFQSAVEVRSISQRLDHVWLDGYRATRINMRCTAFKLRALAGLGLSSFRSALGRTLRAFMN